MKLSKRAQVDRRSFLKTLGQAGLSVNMMRGATFTTAMMASRAVEAAAVPGIKRVVMVFIPGGAPSGKWLPSGNLTMNETTSSLESVKDKCIFFSNAAITNKAGGGVGGHGNTSKAFGSSGFNTSYDVDLANTLGGASAFPHLMLGVQSNGHGSATKKNYSEVNYQDDPLVSFNRVFSGGASVGDIGTRRSMGILDVHKAELDELQKFLGNSEKHRLDEHLNSVEKLEQRLAMANSGGGSGDACSNPVWNEGGFVYDSANKTKWETESELQVDTAVLAMKCNLTNVVSIMLGNHQSEHAIPHLNYTGDYHQSIHGGQRGAYEECRTYLNSRMAYLISELDKAGLLESTLVIQTTDMGDGNAHNSEDAPVMMASGSNGLNIGSVVSANNSHMNVFDTATEILGLNGQIDQRGSGALAGVIK